MEASDVTGDDSECDGRGKEPHPRDLLSSGLSRMRFTLSDRAQRLRTLVVIMHGETLSQCTSSPEQTRIDFQSSILSFFDALISPLGFPVEGRAIDSGEWLNARV